MSILLDAPPTYVSIPTFGPPPAYGPPPPYVAPAPTYGGYNQPSAPPPSYSPVAYHQPKPLPLPSCGKKFAAGLGTVLGTATIAMAVSAVFFYSPVIGILTMNVLTHKFTKNHSIRKEASLSTLALVGAIALPLLMPKVAAVLGMVSVGFAVAAFSVALLSQAGKTYDNYLN